MLYSNYMLNTKTKRQTQAFLEGLYLVISKEHLSFFFAEEI